MSTAASDNITTGKGFWFPKYGIYGIIVTPVPDLSYWQSCLGCCSNYDVPEHFASAERSTLLGTIGITRTMGTKVT